MLFLKLICHHKTHLSVSWVMLARWRPLAYIQSPSQTWTRPPEFILLFEFFLVFDRLRCATLRPRESRAVTERKHINSFSPFANKNWEHCELEAIRFISAIVLIALCFCNKLGKYMLVALWPGEFHQINNGRLWKQLIIDPYLWFLLGSGSSGSSNYYSSKVGCQVK